MKWMKKRKVNFFIHFSTKIPTINSDGEIGQFVGYWNYAKNGWAKQSKKRVTKLQIFLFLTWSFASRFLLRFAQSFSAKLKLNNKLVILPTRFNYSIEKKRNFRTAVCLKRKTHEFCQARVIATGLAEARSCLNWTFLWLVRFRR